MTYMSGSGDTNKTSILTKAYCPVGNWTKKQKHTIAVVQASKLPPQGQI